MNDPDTITLDCHAIEMLKTPKGGYKRKTLECFGHNDQPAMRYPSRSAQAIRNDPDRAKTEHDLSRMEQARIKRERKGARV